MDHNLHADRIPTSDDMARQELNSHFTYQRGDLVVHPSTWGSAIMFVLGAAPGDLVACTVAMRNELGGYVPEPGWTEGHYKPTALVRVDPDTLKLDPQHATRDH